jgi:hypothetical protein
VPAAVAAAVAAAAAAAVAAAVAAAAAAAAGFASTCSLVPALTAVCDGQYHSPCHGIHQLHIQCITGSSRLQAARHLQ